MITVCCYCGAILEIDDRPCAGVSHGIGVGCLKSKHPEVYKGLKEEEDDEQDNVLS